MRKIKESDYVSFTVSNGWNLTVYTFNEALKQYNAIPHGTLYGNKPNGDKAIIDSK